MRKMRQDEIELIERFRKNQEKGSPLIVDEEGRSNQGFSKGDPVFRMATFDEYMKDIEKEQDVATERANEEFRSVGIPCQCVPVPVEDFPQEDTIDQIKRIAEHLPRDCECGAFSTECDILRDLMISDWARGFLKQMIREREREIGR